MTAMETTGRLYDGAAGMYMGWVNMQLSAAERMARVARVWIDEMVAVQQDMAQATRRSLEESKATLATGSDTPSPMGALGRVTDAARANYFLWTETGLKARERYGRVAQTAFSEMQSAGSEIAGRMERGVEDVMRRTTAATR